MADRTAYYWNESLGRRDTGVFCPEHPRRIAMLNPVHVLEAHQDVVVRSFSPREPSLLQAVHSPEYISSVRTAHARQRMFLDAGDTRVTANIFEQALLSASAGCAALDEILTGRLVNAFCAVRPPGHHANAIRALGFCVFNNVAIAARYAQREHGVARILIVDWDVHPGNGTQEIFWQDPSVFALSFHQSGHMGESGRVDLCGEGPGLGFNRNVELPPGTNAASYLALFKSIVTETANRFRPELVIIAAGFDAHQDDPASQLGLRETDFARMTQIVISATRQHTNDRTLSILEGGYNPGMLQASVQQHVAALERAASDQPVAAGHAHGRC